MSAVGARVELSPYASAAPELLALGYHPIPIQPGSKAPGDYRGGAWRGMSEWQKYRDRPPSDFELSLWSRNYPDANVCVVLGSPAGPGFYLVAVDIDVDDADAFDELIRQVPASPMRKRGMKGETRFYRAAKSFKSRSYNRMSDRRRLVDVLTGFDARQTICPPSIHKDTGAPYAWLAGPAAADSLPEFTSGDLEKLEEALGGLGWSADADRKPAVKASGRDHGQVEPDDFWSEVKAAALARLPEWVPQLDLYGCRRARGGYEAVATWRPSSTGRPLEQRKRNLSIQSTGIKDFGEDRGYSAIDLVMAARGVDQAAATDWLRETLGLKEAGVVIQLASPSAPPPPPAQLEELPDALTRPPGLLGEITDWICDTARRPQRGLALGAALTVIGTAAGRKYAGPTISGTHLYVLGLAGTGAGKDHALKQIARILTACEMGQHIGPGQFMSWQAMVSDLARQPLMLCPMDEFGAFLTRINQRGSSGTNNERGMSAIFRSAWGTSFDTMPAVSWAGKDGKSIQSPALSVYGASVHEEFYRALSGMDVSNGFLNRFLLISTRVAKLPKKKPRIERFDVPDMIKRKLQAIYGSGSALVKSTMHNGQADAPLYTCQWASPKVEAVFEAFSGECEDLEEEQPLWGRTAEIAVRLATIRAIGLDATNLEIEPADMAWGVDLARWSTSRLIAEVADHLAETPFQAEAQRVLRKIKQRGRISRRDLSRALGVQTKKRDLQEVLDSLIEAGLVATEDTVPAGGGTRTPWFWAT